MKYSSGDIFIYKGRRGGAAEQQQGKFHKIAYCQSAEIKSDKRSRCCRSDRGFCKMLNRIRHGETWVNKKAFCFVFGFKNEAPIVIGVRGDRGVEKSIAKIYNTSMS
ncbi:MAG: hypothetical protein SGJ10_12195 [Bacteroidota bacterium]|nr:hypothetical protein [Bacteroidota bacterium]